LGGIDPGPDVPIDIERLPKPRPKGTFSTVVIDAATTTPIERYQIQFVTRGSSWGRSSKDADGRWRSDPIDVGRYQVAVNATGYAPLTHPIEVTENQDAGPLAFALLRADSRLVGQVHDRDGQSLARSRVWLCTSDGEPALRIGDDSVEADSRGGFTFGGLAKGDYLVVAFENPKHDAPSRELAPASMRVSVRGETTLDLQLLPGVAVRLEPRGPGIESAAVSVRVRDARGAWVRDDLGGGGVCSQSGGGGISVLLAPGWYCAEVHADGFRVGRVEFVAAPDVVVPIELIRNDR
jgi:hypothetical protein